MKNFSDILIVACLMVHDDHDYTKMVLDNVSKYTDQIYVNLNDPTPEAEEVVRSHKNVVKIIRTSNEGRWNQGFQRDNSIRMLDDIEPDIVLFPDSDELYPNNIQDQLKTFWEDEEAITFWFRLIYLWGDENHFRNDGLFKTIHHVRAFKWSTDISYIPYAGYACPSNYINLDKPTKYHSNSPTLHYGYEKEENRIRKYERDNCSNCDPKEREKNERNILILQLPDELKPIK